MRACSTVTRSKLSMFRTTPKGMFSYSSCSASISRKSDQSRSSRSSVGSIEVGLHLPDSPIDQFPIPLRGVLLPHPPLDLPGQEQGEGTGGLGVFAEALDDREPGDGDHLVLAQSRGDPFEFLDLLEELLPFLRKLLTLVGSALGLTRFLAPGVPGSARDPPWLAPPVMSRSPSPGP